MKLLVGDLKPTIGEAKVTPGCRVAVVNQHHADQLDLDLTPLAFMKRQFPGDGSYNQDQKLRSHLASCGVGSDKMLVIIHRNIEDFLMTSLRNCLRIFDFSFELLPKVFILLGFP